MRAIKTHELTPLNMPASQTDVLWLYNGLDVCVTLEVAEAILPSLDNLTTVVYERAKALQAPCLEMALRGTLVDQNKRASAITFYEAQIKQLEAQLNRILFEGLGLELNWRSPAQLQKLFYEILGIPPVTFKGKITVNRDALEKIESYFFAMPIVRHLLTMRDLGKKVSTLKTDFDSDGRIRTTYNIAGTTTGRFSSSYSVEGTGGNLQNVENRLRSIFIADPGMKLAYIDLEQAESRLVGALCWNLFHDGKYLDACESGDLHTSVCRLAWTNLSWTGDLKADKEIAEVPFYRQHSYRHMAKVLGHGCLTADHDVLTRDGWVPITQKPKEIMTWTMEKSEFQLVNSWADFPYEGELQSFEGNSISAVMTHDHRVPYKSDNRTKNIKERPASSGPGLLMPLGDNYIGGNKTVPARLIAALMADGHQEENWMSFHFIKQRKIDRLRKLCEQYQFEYRIHGDKIRVAGRLPKHPGPFMFEWTAQCLRDFIDELKYWDGHIAETSVSISSTHPEDLEWFQTFGRLVGVGGQIQKPQLSGFGSIVFRLQQNKRKWAAGSSLKHKRILCNGQRVLCPSVKASWFYVRRNGKIYVTGNSNYQGQPPTMAKHTKLEVGPIKEFQGKYFTAFPAIPMWHAWVADQLREHGFLISLMGRRRWFFGRRTEASTIREAIAFDPQGSVGDILNTGMLQVWRLRRCQLLMQIHDAILVQFPEEAEQEIVPLLIETIKVPVELKHGRQLIIPSSAETGWNFAKFNGNEFNKDGSRNHDYNPDGLNKFRMGVKDERRRIGNPALGLLDRRV